MFFQSKVVACLLLLFLASSASAGEAGLMPVVSSFSASVASVARETDAMSRQKKALNLLQEYFDFETFARWTLHDHWDGLSAGQRARFLKLFHSRFMANVMDRLSRRSERRIKLKVIGRDDRNEFTEVFGKILHNGSSDDLILTWVYRNNRWGLADVSVAGADLVANYQGQFNKIIRKRGFEGLLKILAEL